MYRHTRALGAFLAVLFIFLLVSGWTVVSTQREIMTERSRQNAEQGLDMIRSVLLDSLLRHDYASVEQIVLDWGQKHDDIAGMLVAAPNGYVLAEYEKPGVPESRRLRFGGGVVHLGRRIVSLDMAMDLGPVQRDLRALSIRLITQSLAVTCLMGVVLWLTLRRTAIRPLQEEIARRTEAEDGIKEARDRLEERVAERTAELMEANALLEEQVQSNEQMFEDLSRSERSYRTLAQNIPDVVYRVKLTGHGGTEFLNDGMALLTGLSPGELAAEGMRSIEPLVLKEDLGRRLAAMADAVTGRAPFEVEYRIVHRDGGIRHVLERGRPVDGEGGEPTHIDGVIIDITGLRKAEEERLRLTSTLSAVIDHIPEGVLLLDDRGVVALANPIGEAYLKAVCGAGLGDSVETIAGKPLREYLVSPPNILRHEVQAGEGPEQRVFELAARAIAREGRQTGMVLAIKDATEERRLQGRVAAQDRLAAVGHLAAGIAHDFNNTLTCVIGFSEMMLYDVSLPERYRRQLEAIFKSGERAKDLVGQILDFSRKSASEFRVFDLAPFMREFMDFIGRAVPESIEVRLSLSGEQAAVRADRAKLQQVLANLVVNARDAMPEGGTLTVGLDRRVLGPGSPPPLPDMPHGEWIALSVSDTGDGIPKDVLPHIFEPFYTTKGLGKGTGLGLSQVYGIVRQHEGHVEVRTGRGRGASFVVYLPAAEPAPAVSPAVAEEARPALPRGRGETVLVVEDDEVVRELIARLLTSLGYAPIVASNGAEALETFRARMDDIRLVITDVVMPEMDGLALSREIRALKPDMKVVGVSGYALGLDRDALRGAGFADWVQKPFEPSALARMVGRALNPEAKAAGQAWEGFTQEKPL